MKTRISKVLIGLITAALLSCGLAACGGVDGKADAITVNGETLSVGTANFWLRFQQAQTYTMMANYGMGTESLWSTDYSASSSDDRTYGEATKEAFTEEMEKYMVIRQHAEEYGVKLTDDMNKKLDEAVAATMSANAEAFKRMGVGEDNVREMLEILTIYSLMYEPMVEDTDREVSDDEAAQSTITYARITRSATDGEGNAVDPTEDQETAWKDEMTALLDAVKASGDVAGADISALAEETAPDVYATSYSYGADDATLPDEVKEAIATLSDGEIYDGVIETESFYYLVRLDHVFDEEATEQEKESIISQREQELFSQKSQEWLDEAEVSVSADWEKLTISDEEVYELATTSTSE